MGAPDLVEQVARLPFIDEVGLVCSSSRGKLFRQRERAGAVDGRQKDGE